MKYRKLGGTGLTVSEIGFGCGNVGGLMVRGSPVEQLEAIRHALDLGINYFDTAPAYGDGRSETNLGQVLKQINSPLFVATKFSIGPSDMGDIQGAVRRSLEASLVRLGRRQVDVLQLHTPVTAERGVGPRWSVSAADVLGRGGIVDALDTLVSEGLARFVGFTGLGDVTALHAVIKSGRFDVVQAYYNLLNPSAGLGVPSGFVGQDFGKLIDLASAQGMGVVVIRVMAGGALGGAVARTGHASPSVGGALTAGAAYEQDVARAHRLGFLPASGIPLPQAAVRFALMREGVSTVLVGYSDKAQIEQATACSGAGPLPATAMDRLNELWASDFGLAA